MPSGSLPESALVWASANAPADVVDVVPVSGGITNTKWMLRLADGGTAVLRWAEPTAWGETGREHVVREALACRLLAGSPVVLPKLLACDPDGSSAGGPANLLSWIPGASRLDPLSPASLTALARTAVAIHAHATPASHRPPVFSYRVPSDLQVPWWSQRPGLWRRAIELWRGDAPSTAHGLIHRDFHLGNVLWDAEKLSGIVDWAETSWGPSDLDVAHLCSDFAMVHTLADAMAFRTAYLDQGGTLDSDAEAARYWMVSDILGFLPDPAHILPGFAGSRPDLTADDVRIGLEDLLELTLS